MTRITYVNGAYIPHVLAAVHVEDRGFQFADSVYEVCAFEGTKIIDEQAHLARLEQSLASVEVAMPMSRRGLGIIFREVVRKNKLTSGIIYCQVTRGKAKRDHAFPNPAPLPTLVVSAKRIAPETLDARRKNGVSIVFRSDERWARCDIKSTGLLANVLAKQSARSTGAYEAWLFDEDGNVTEGTSTNAWIVLADGSLVTRPLDQHILGGVTRAKLIECAQGANIPVIERKFATKEVATAAEAFSSASTIGALPVVSIDGTPIGSGTPGPITRRLNELYRKSSQ